MHLSPVIRLRAPGQAAKTSPEPIKSTQGKVKANRRAAGGTRTGETRITQAQRESEPVKSLLYGSCNPISTFREACPGRNYMGIYPPI